MIQFDEKDCRFLMSAIDYLLENDEDVQSEDKKDEWNHFVYLWDILKSRHELLTKTDLELSAGYGDSKEKP